MKLIYILLLLLCLVSPVFAASSATETMSGSATTKVSVLTISWTAHTDGTFTTYTTTNTINGWVFMVVTNPGSTAPTDNYDITLLDTDGVDIMGTALANRDTSTSEQAFPYVDATNYVYGPRYVNGKLQLTISNNSVNSATGTVVVYFRR